MILDVQQIHGFYGKSHILHGVSLEVGKGEVVGLLGRNGVGKSTTLKAIMGLVHPSQGSVLFEGLSLLGRRPSRVMRTGIVQVPEGRMVFPDLTVLENLENFQPRQRCLETDIFQIRGIRHRGASLEYNTKPQ